MRASLSILLVLMAAGCLGACAPQIGDPCSTSVDCPQGATCDTTARGGYCLEFDCAGGSCPDESVCIPFRSFSACMRYCSNNSDCRTDQGMVCRSDRGSAKFCYHPETEP